MIANRNMLPDFCAIYAGTNSLDAAFSPTVSKGTQTGADVQCRLVPLSSDESMQYDRETAQIVWKLLLAPYDAAGAAVAVKHQAIVTIGGSDYTVMGQAQAVRDGNGLPVLYRVTVKLEK